MSTRKNPPPVSDNLRLDRDALDQVVAIVIDANAYGHARPDLANLAALAERMHSVGIATWVPEPVAWEWAQHLSEDWAALQELAGQERRRLRRAGLRTPDQTAGYANKQAVIQAFLTELDGIDHVEIVELTEASAAAGLRDQVLQSGPASRKEGVKTGASDSAWLRDVIAKADNDTEPLVFVTEDADIDRACTAWGYPKPVLRKLSEIRATILEVELDTGAIAWLLLRYLAERLPTDMGSSATPGGTAASLDGVAGLQIGNLPDLAKSLDPDPRDNDEQITDASLTRLTALVGINSVTVEQHVAKQPAGQRPDVTEPVDRTVAAWVLFLADATAVVTHRGETVDPQGDERFIKHFSGLLVRTKLVFELQDQAVVAVRPEGDAYVFADDRSFDDDGDAIGELIDALTLVPGLEVPGTWGDWRTVEHQIVIPESSTVLETYWAWGDSWSVTFIWDDDQMEVSCEYDVNAWVGGKDGFHIDPPYYIVAEGSEFAEHSPICSVPAWIIDKVLRDERPYLGSQNSNGP